MRLVIFMALFLVERTLSYRLSREIGKASSGEGCTVTFG